MALDRKTLELTFGRDNISKWADLDNHGDDADIELRIDHALSWAASHFDSMLKGMPTPPSSIVVDDVKLRLAGIWLYESRGITEQDATRSPIAHHRKYCYDWIDGYIKSVIRFTLPNGPSVI
jgi:hypothetical protein